LRQGEREKGKNTMQFERIVAILGGWLAAATLCAAQAPPAAGQAPVPLDAFIKQDSFNTIKLSPTGEHFAVSVPLEDRTVLAILRRSDQKRTGLFNMRGKTHVMDFWWVSDDTVLIALGEKQGGLDQPVPTGELVTVRADGTGQKMVFGFRMDGDGVGSNVKGRSAEYASGFLVHELPEDDDTVLIGVWPWSSSSADTFTEAEKVNLRGGRRVTVARAPVRRAMFVADHEGEVRFAYGAGADNNVQTYYRSGNGGAWELIASEAADGFATTPLAFSADGSVAYLQVGSRHGPDAIYAFDPGTRKRSLLVRDDNVDPARLVWSEAPREPIGALFMDGKPRIEFFDKSRPLAKLNAALQNSFNGEFAYVTSMTRDGKLALVRTFSDRSPGDYYLFDVEAKKAQHVLSKRAAIDPERMGERRPVEFQARDGRTVHGFLTIPAGSDGRNLPLVLHPHGGPIGVYDDWTFNRDSQLLASRGYAVLQVNYRGSGNYGHEFQRAGYRQWGGAMQDDLTDATRWAIQQGITDPKRICIYGASYGGYASLMGVAKEPDLYRCAIGYVGVYDMPMMYGRGDIQGRQSGFRYLEEALGRDNLDAISPTRLASRIKVPVFLAAGGEDERAPIEHSEKMERALKKAGVPVETLYYDTEAHGFYTEEHNREYYTRLLAFLDKHIGSGAKSP
jgi:dipeptidyl aminopeptidase/acylaminoacyl peptidase